MCISRKLLSQYGVSVPKGYVVIAVKFKQMGDNEVLGVARDGKKLQQLASRLGKTVMIPITTRETQLH